MDGGSFLQDFLIIVKNNILGICVVVSLFVEITPIKVNPISAIMDFLLKSVKNDVKEMKDDIDEKIDIMEKSIIEIKDAQDKNRFSTCRWEILTFASSINNGQLFTDQEYLHIKDIIAEYDILCKKCNLTNGYTDDAVKRINNHYDKYKNSGTKYF